MLKNKRGFTFIELSIVILIISLLFAGTSVIFSKIRGATQTNETKERLYKIKKALEIYFLENQILPCPAGLKLTSSDDGFGVSGACIEALNEGIYLNNNIVYGAIPFRDLGIYPDLTYDGWGNKFSYVIDTRFTDSATFIETSGEGIIEIYNLDNNIDDDGNGLDVNDKDDEKIIRNNAIVVIISHGMNRKGAFKQTTQNLFTLDDVNTFNESDNIIDEENTPFFNNEFVDDFRTETFDDILTYFDKENFYNSIKIERVGCLETNIPDYNYDANGTPTTITWTGSNECTNGLCEYEEGVQSQTTCTPGSYPDHYFSRNSEGSNPLKKCLKSGVWSEVKYPCIPGCGENDLLDALDDIDAGDDPYTIANLDNINQPWLKVSYGEDIVLKCDGSKIGYVRMTCQDNTGTGTEGKWIQTTSDEADCSTICKSGNCTNNCSGNCNDNTAIIPTS